MGRHRELLNPSLKAFISFFKEPEQNFCGLDELNMCSCFKLALQWISWVLLGRILEGIFFLFSKVCFETVASLESETVEVHISDHDIGLAFFWREDGSWLFLWRKIDKAPYRRKEMKVENRKMRRQQWISMTFGLLDYGSNMHYIQGRIIVEDSECFPYQKSIRLCSYKSIITKFIAKMATILSWYYPSYFYVDMIMNAVK